MHDAFIAAMGKIYSILILSICISTILSCSKTRQNPEVQLTVLSSLERIGQNEKPFGELQAVIKAAKNEIESFQVVVSALEKNVRVVKAEMSDLKGKARTIGKENIALFREEYTRVRRSSGRAQLPPGLYPDPLVPFIDPQTGAPIEPFS